MKTQTYMKPLNCIFITWPKTRKTIGDVFLKFFHIQIIVKYKNNNKKPKF